MDAFTDILPEAYTGFTFAFETQIISALIRFMWSSEQWNNDNDEDFPQEKPHSRKRNIIPTRASDYKKYILRHKHICREMPAISVNFYAGISHVYLFLSRVFHQGFFNAAAKTSNEAIKECELTQINLWAKMNRQLLKKTCD